MSKTTVWRVLRKRLVFEPYRTQMVQQLSDEDHRRWLDSCLQLQDLMSSDDHFLEKVQFSDEATFHVSGAVNRRNFRICGSENPRAYVENLNTVSMCAVSPVVHTSNISSCIKKKKSFFSFPVAVNNSIKVGPLVFCYKCL